MRQTLLPWIFPPLRWTVLPNMPTARSVAGAFCLEGEGEKVLVIGGSESIRSLNVVEMLENKPGEVGWTWRKLADLHEARCYPGIAVIAGRVVVAGGTPVVSVETLTLPKDDSDLGQWTLLQNSFTKCSQTTWLFQFNGRILKLGRFQFGGLHFNHNAYNRPYGFPNCLSASQHSFCFA